jgi:hypothetical protein
MAECTCLQLQCLCCLTLHAGISNEEFHAILEEEELKDALILIYANKQVGEPGATFVMYPV